MVFAREPARNYLLLSAATYRAMEAGAQLLCYRCGATRVRAPIKRRLRDERGQAMFADKQAFKDSKIVLDGSSFYGCTFTRCVLVFSGVLPVTMESNVFNDCHWEFAGPAQETLLFLSALHGAGAAELVETTFDRIRGLHNPAASVFKQ
jgi:hypothetical protein